MASPVSGLDGFPTHLRRRTDDVDGDILNRFIPTYFCPPLNLFIQIYDYICSLHEEWTFLLWSRWTKVKVLYIIARYVPFLITTVHLYLAVAPDENTNKCQILVYIITSLGLISLTCSECLFVLRTYALWNKSKILLVAMLSSLFAVTVSSFIISFTSIIISYSTGSAIPGCHQSFGSFSFFMPFTLMFVFQLVLVSLTLVRVIRSWRSARRPLYAILLKHNIFYYACGLFLSAVNVLVPLLPFFDSVSYFLPEGFETFILAILATRMHLHLWHMNQHVDGSDTIVWISMSDMSPADRTV
ncbi:uncharacterized protein BJ212DRAFT_1484657 [Suillus subaureus]|uniref:DUF6533 domain-containing protein n=1 Tax=Suillus subaureus TaxID=48587 RepID=A0A9P7J949_9AGAM|nr:uncharacterized protein BJ212DRAFT_1484657 [Suillus subaureus]KAG1809150.1 hypothetical protein BJ212DRAFT_1484657 [Suillus subaureus]